MAIRAMTAVSENLDDARAAGSEVAQAILDGLKLGKRSVAIVLSTIELDLAELTAGIRAKLDMPIIGCTTYSEATAAGYTEDSATLLVLTSDTAEFAVGIGERLVERGAEAVTEAWNNASKQLTGPPALVIAFPDGALSAKAEVVVEALAGVTRGSIPVMGGCPGDGGAFKKTFQVCNDRVTTDSVPLLLVAGPKVEPIVVTRTGWEPMGVKGVATKVDGTTILEIDGRPAIEYLQRYLSDVDDPEVLGTFPIALFEKGADTGGDRPVLRSPFFYDKATGAVTYGGSIYEGCEVQMGRAYRERVVESTTAAAAQVLERRSGRRPACVLFASCGARKLVLGAAIHKEIGALREAFGGDVPIAGFYSYGEIGPFDSTDPINRPRYHNCTLVLCAL